jgi:hypothetical protein
MLTSWEKLVEYIGTNYRIRSLWCLPNQSILPKSWHNMPFKNRSFGPDKQTYNKPAYPNESSWKLQSYLE